MNIIKNSILIFIFALFILLVYLAFLAKAFTGDWFAILFAAEMPLSIIAVSMAPMIYLTWKIFPIGRGRSDLIYGFSILIILIIYTLTVDKYSFVFPKEKWIYNLHPIEPILFTILVLYLLKGTSRIINYFD